MRIREKPSGHRQDLLDAALRFVQAAVEMPGVRQISLLGSITTTKPNPKDIDLLVVVSDDMDLKGLASQGRRLKGAAQQLNLGADIFLADERGCYLGRTCHWRVCRPGQRLSCDALHCGRRPYLHDDLSAIQLSTEIVQAPPITLWPTLIRRRAVPADVEQMIQQFLTGSHSTERETKPHPRH